MKQYSALEEIVGGYIKISDRKMPVLFNSLSDSSRVVAGMLKINEEASYSGFMPNMTAGLTSRHHDCEALFRRGTWLYRM